MNIMAGLDISNNDLESDKSDEGGDYELWAEETVDIETPFTNTSQDDVEYLKLEIAELKQILIALAEKYKLSEDRRKVAERRNSFLKADNMRLQQVSDCSLSQKIEAEIENRRTLDKLREFIDFKAEFEKQAELLKKIISHLPRMKNAATSTKVHVLEKSEQCSGDLPSDRKRKTSNTRLNKVSGSGDNNANVDDCQEDKFFDTNDTMIEEKKAATRKDMCDEHCQTQDERLLIQSVDSPNENAYQWGHKCRKDSIPDTIILNEPKKCKSIAKLSKLKQEVLALKNMNDWKTNDLDYKNQQLAVRPYINIRELLVQSQIDSQVKNRELTHAKKEITQLKMRVNQLLIEQQKRPSTCYVNQSHLKNIENKRQENPKEDGQLKLSGQTSKIKQDVAKAKAPPVDELKKKQSNRQSSDLSKANESNKLPVSNESVWREIAPGDQVRIKMKKQT